MRADNQLGPRGESTEKRGTHLFVYEKTSKCFVSHGRRRKGSHFVHACLLLVLYCRWSSLIYQEIPNIMHVSYFEFPCIPCLRDLTTT